MNNYIVTVILPDVRLVQTIQADYAIDAINTVIDDLQDDYLDVLTGNLTIICKPKESTK